MFGLILIIFTVIVLWYVVHNYVEKQNFKHLQKEMLIEQQQKKQQEEQQLKRDEQLRKDQLLAAKQYEAQLLENEKAFSEMLTNLSEFKVYEGDPILKNNVDEMPNLQIARPPKDEETIKTLCDFVVIDVETTGLSPKRNKIVEISAVRFIDFMPAEYMTTLINPKTKMPISASEINHITDEMLKNMPAMDVTAQSFIDFIGKEKIIVAHNIEFDMKFLYANGIDLFLRGRKFYDTLAIARSKLKKYDVDKQYRSYDTGIDYNYDIINYKLSTLIDYYDIYTPAAHRSLNDCICTGYLFKKLLDEL